MHRRGGEQEQAAERTCTHPPEHGDFRAPAVGDATSPWTAEKRGDVLNADDQSSERGVVAEAEMNVPGQNRERQADREIDHETESGEADDVPRAAV